MTILKFGIRGLTATLLLLSTVAGASEVRWTFDGDIHIILWRLAPMRKLRWPPTASVLTW